MRKLSGIDATFLYMETDETPMHISSLLICEPTRDGENAYEALKSQIVNRLHEIPAFHRKLMHTPFYIDHPVWVDTDVVDLDYHIKHIRLPEPGNLEQLRMVVQGLHSLVLDRNRPLWQFYIVEGVEDAAFGLKKGSFALYTKCHHACLDGGGGISAMDILSDTEPTPRAPLPKSEIRFSNEKPGFFELLGSAYGKFIQQQVDNVVALPALSKALGNMTKNAFEDGEGLLKRLRPAPKTRFNVRIQKQRAFAANSLSLKETIALAKATGTSVNDIALSICGGALRRYLDGHKELPNRSLVAAVPVSLRELGDKGAGNQVASMTCEIGSHIADPLKRLKAVNRNTKRAKKQMAAIKDIFPTDYSYFGAPIFISAMAQMASKTDIVNRMPAAINVAISNVPGPRKHMYFAGSKVHTYFPVSIATHGCALNITLQSYVDRLDFGLVACKDAVPDVQDIADLIVDEFQLLQRAVKDRDAANKPTPKKRAKAKEK
ncbi:MAG: wax ester/triacylglycerol synthase family O-acyltransferase [Robiginitomaculum sp.]|nr:MAG: wax ester/triacylglycerol synthase family O-acyltransferase [Robiginitomaculum sp.]